MTRRYLDDLRGFGGRRLVVLLLLTLAGAVTDGVGLLLLVPLLELLGTSEGSGVTAALADVLGWIGIDLTLWSILTVYVVLVALRAALTRVRVVQVARFQLEFVDWQRFQMLEAIARADWLFQLQLRGSDVVHGVVADIARVGQGTTLLLQAATSSILAVAYAAVAVRLSLPAAVLAVVLSVLLSGIVWPLVRRARVLGETQTTTGRRAVSAIADLLQGMKVAKVHGAERPLLEEFRSGVGDLRDAQLSFQRVQAVSDFAYQVAAAIALAVLVGVCVEVLEVPTAELLALVVVLSRILPVASGVMGNVRGGVNMLPAYAAAMATLDEARSHQEREVAPSAPLPIREGIALRGVGFRYPTGGAPALDGIDLDLPAHTTTALVGSSGAGKTTLADLVLGLLRPIDGSVLVDGVPLGEVHLGAWRATVAYVPQDPFLFHDTIRANVNWPDGSGSDDEIVALLAQVGLGDLVAALPEGISTVVGERGHRLSGGERQRVMLARAMARRPSLLVLDEATSHLDASSERVAKQAIDALRGHVTVLVIAHRLETVRDADQIVVLDHGRVVETGSWEVLASSGGRFGEMLLATEG